MKKFFRKAISLALVLGMMITMIPNAWADEDTTGAAAPPELFSVYINVDGNKTPALLKSYTGTEMRLLAKASRANYVKDDSYKKIKEDGTIYYTAASQYSFNCGRAVTEYITIADFLEDLDVSFDSGDYLVMGPDYTIMDKYSEYNKGSSEANYDYWKNYGWYSYDDLYGERYYFKNWDETQKIKVPSIISLRSYGGSGWTEETYWDMYAGSSDYLWAYVVNFGQKTPTESTYNRFYYQTTECTIKLSDTAPVQPVVKSLLKEKCDEVKNELDTTLTGTNAAEIAEGSFWVTEAQKIALQNAYDTYKVYLDDETSDGEQGSGSGSEQGSGSGSESGGGSDSESGGGSDTVLAKTNGEVYGAYTSLSKALTDFKAAKREGVKTGFAWFAPDAYESTQTYTIRTKTQLSELAELVNGTADLGASMAQAYDFEGKTIILAADIDLDRNRVTIGNEEHPFKGIFDGNGHELSNLRVSRSSGYAGLFGLNEGTIKNLTLSGNVSSSVNVKASQAASAPVGGIAAVNRGTIEGCKNEASVSAVGASEVGGIAGRNEGIVKDCLNAGEISGFQNTGGIVGYLYGTSAREAKVVSSLNAGIIKASCSDSQANSNAGGVVGGVGADKDVYPLIDSCINSGSVESAGKTAGGIVGGAWIGELTVSSCYNVGNVTTTAEGYNAPTQENGTSTGDNDASAAGNGTSTAGNGTSTGDKDSSASTQNKADAYNIGAIAGRSKGTVEKSFWLEGTAESGIGHAKSDIVIQSVNSSELEGLAQELGDEYTAVDNGYPVLKWQTVYQVGFDLSQKDFIDTHNVGEYLPCAQPADPEIRGQRFGGWYTSADYNDLYDFSDLVCENKTIYAKLTERSSGKGNGSAGGSTGGAADEDKDDTNIGTGDDADSGKTDTSLFDDVSSSDWFNSAVNYVANKGIMTGTASRTFSPASSTTRGMLMTILARMSGVDTTGSSPWYQAGLDWAVEKGISDGTNPEKEITREQLAAMLYRYAGSPQTSGDISKFSDAKDVSSYAENAVKWAVEKGIVTGKGDNTLAPGKNATRAEMAAMIQRYCNLSGEK